MIIPFVSSEGFSSLVSWRFFISVIFDLDNFAAGLVATRIFATGH